jgi:hypothetical protein
MIGGNIAVDPGFVDGFHLGPVSPCIDSGTPTDAPADDIDGDPRSASFPDIGADEWGDFPDRCAGAACSGHGTCVRAGLDASCECDAGYQNPANDEFSCVPIPDGCEGVTCSGHGACVTAGAEAACDCHDGFSGPNCELGTIAIAGGNTWFTSIVGDNTLRSWGRGPAITPSGTFTAIDCSILDMCGVQTNGRALCWGAIIGTVLPDDTFTSVVRGVQFVCGLHTDGTVACWGDYDGPPGTFSALTAGHRHACGIQSPSGAVSCWGDDSQGQASPPGDAFLAIDAAQYTTCGIRSADGFIVCWGASAFGGATIPAGPFTTLSISHEYLAGGVDTRGFGCAIQPSGAMACWGDGSHGRLHAPSGSYDLIATTDHSACARRTDGVVKCWGSSSFGLLDPP